MALEAQSKPATSEPLTVRGLDMEARLKKAELS